LILVNGEQDCHREKGIEERPVVREDEEKLVVETKEGGNPIRTKGGKLKYVTGVRK